MLAALHTPEGLCHSAAAWREDAEFILLCRMSQRCHCHVLQDSLESSLLSSGTPRHGVYGASSGALLRGPLGLPSPGMFPMSLPLTAGETAVGAFSQHSPDAVGAPQPAWQLPAVSASASTFSVQLSPVGLARAATDLPRRSARLSMLPMQRADRSCLLSCTLGLVPASHHPVLSV